MKNKVEIKVKKNKQPDQDQKKMNTKKAKKETRKMSLLILDIATVYDLSAKKEEYPLSAIKITMGSEPKIGNMCTMKATLDTKLDPYLYQVGQKEHEFAWDHGQYLGKIIASKLDISMNLSPKDRSAQEKKKKETALDDQLSWLHEIKEKDHNIDFDTPWSIGCQFSRHSQYNPALNKNNLTKQINFEGSCTLLKKWKFNGSTSYDFIEKKWVPSATSFSIQHDLHCWQLSYKCYPLEEKIRYEFSLGAKANILKALKLPNRKRSLNRLK